MKRKQYAGQMSLNPNFLSGGGAIDTYPLMVGELVGPRGGSAGGVVWWSRYRMNGASREAALYPLIGVQLGEDRWRVEVTPSEDRKSLRGRWSACGWEAIVDVRPRGRGEAREAGVTVTLTGEAYVIRTAGIEKPTEFYFPSNPQYVPRALQARLP